MKSVFFFIFIEAVISNLFFYCRLYKVACMEPFVPTLKRFIALFASCFSRAYSAHQLPLNSFIKMFTAPFSKSYSFNAALQITHDAYPHPAGTGTSAFPLLSVSNHFRMNNTTDPFTHLTIKLTAQGRANEWMISSRGWALFSSGINFYILQRIL